MDTKICNTCKLTKPVTPELWSISSYENKKHGPGFVKGQCKDCINRKARRYNASAAGRAADKRCKSKPQTKKKQNLTASTRRQEKKKELVALLGGGCSKCGYNKCNAALDFHHINPSEKSFSLNTRGLGKTWPVLLEEVKKCILLCANCHREHHHG